MLFTTYQRIVGKRIYLTITRPNITFSISLLSQNMNAPTVHHLSTMKCILRYLKGTGGRGIVMTHNRTHILWDIETLTGQAMY